MEEVKPGVICAPHTPHPGSFQKEKKVETKSLIQATANVVRVTSLKVGDVFKLVDETYSSVRVLFGVVLDLLNSGTKSFVQVLQYENSYGDIKPEIKVYAGDKDINLFPATVDEVRKYMGEAIASQAKKIEDKRAELSGLIAGVEKAKEFMSGEMSRQLTATAFSVMEQGEYDYQVEQRKRLAQQI
jgi:hypothetical protein